MTAVDPGPPGEAPPSPPFLLHDPAAAPRTGLVVAPHGDIMPAAGGGGPVPAGGLAPHGSARCSLSTRRAGSAGQDCPATG
jgi:hypothetical protein